jgi:hypothetical protein
LAFIPLTQLNKAVPPVELWLSLNKATTKPATVRLAMTPAFAKLLGPDVGVGTNVQLSLGVGEDAGLGLLKPGDGPKLRSQNKRLDCSCAQIPPAPIDGPAGERWTLQNVARSNTLVKHELRPEGVVFTIPREWWTIERDAAAARPERRPPPPRLLACASRFRLRTSQRTAPPRRRSPRTSSGAHSRRRAGWRSRRGPRRRTGPSARSRCLRPPLHRRPRPCSTATSSRPSAARLRSSTSTRPHSRPPGRATGKGPPRRDAVAAYRTLVLNRAARPAVEPRTENAHDTVA